MDLYALALNIPPVHTSIHAGGSSARDNDEKTSKSSFKDLSTSVLIIVEVYFFTLAYLNQCKFTSRQSTKNLYGLFKFFNDVPPFKNFFFFFFLPCPAKIDPRCLQKKIFLWTRIFFFDFFFFFVPLLFSVIFRVSLPRDN